MIQQDRIVQKLLDKTVPIPVTNCLAWKFGKDKNGYGKTTYNGKGIRAHRLMYLLYFGAHLDKLCVCHKCDNPSCINPDHLFLGTNKQNMQDKVKKGRLKNGNMFKTHCKHGHEFTEDNTVWPEYKGKIKRRCVSCYVSGYKRRNEIKRKNKDNESTR